MAPKTKEQFARIRAESEEKILNAALELFATKGFKATSISEIAKAAAVSKGLMYNYFSGKNDLLRAIVGRAMDLGHQLFDALDQEYDEPEEEIRRLVHNIIKMTKDNRTFWRLSVALSFQPDAMQIVEDLVASNTQWSIQKGAELFTALKAKDPMHSAMLFGAALDGIFLQYLHVGEEYPLDMMAEHLLNTFLSDKSIHHNYQ